MSERERERERKRERERERSLQREGKRCLVWKYLIMKKEEEINISN